MIGTIIEAIVDMILTIIAFILVLGENLVQWVCDNVGLIVYTIFIYLMCMTMVRALVDEPTVVTETIISEQVVTEDYTVKDVIEDIYGYPFEFIEAISLHETNRHTSPLYVENKNVGGLKNGFTGDFRRFDNYDQSYLAIADRISTYVDAGADSLEDIQEYYCPTWDGNCDKWQSGVMSIYNELKRGK